MPRDLWYRVIGLVYEGPICRSFNDAWLAWEEFVLIDYKPHELNKARQDNVCKMIIGTTKRAVLGANYYKSEGLIGTGQWRAYIRPVLEPKRKAA